MDSIVVVVQSIAKRKVTLKLTFIHLNNNKKKSGHDSILEYAYDISTLYQNISKSLAVIVATSPSI